jgi:hypothetical protein
MVAQVAPGVCLIHDDLFLRKVYGVQIPSAPPKVKGRFR